MHRRLAFDRAPPIQAANYLAIDRAPSNRWIDPDNGFLHVRTSHISKANVGPYYGREIPGSEELGLDPNKVYQLYRDAAELEKAAATSNGKPILIEHVPTYAKDHQDDLVVGSTGTDGTWNAPYLDNSLVIWPQYAIDVIEDESQAELSSCYHYTAVMEPGEIDGVAFDGRMVDIRLNHVALVNKGRAGPDVRVAEDRLEMRTMLKSRKALAVSGGIVAYLAPKLAADSKLSDVAMDTVLAGVTRKTYATDIPKIAARLKTAVSTGKIKLAADADLSDVVEMLDVLKEVTDGEVDDDKIDAAQAADPKEDDPGEDAGALSPAVMEFLKGKLSDEDMTALAAITDKPDDDKPAADDKDTPVPPGQKKDPAMDAAAIERRITAKMRDVRDAERIVRPIVGDIQVAMDSADDVYRFALDARKIDHKGVSGVGLRRMVEMIPPEGVTINAERLAADAAARTTAADTLFKGAQPLIRS